MANHGIENTLYFSKKAVEGLPAPEKGQSVFYDSDCRGLAVRITPNERRTFFIEKFANGEKQRKTLGTYPELDILSARRHALTFLSEMANWKASNYDGPNPWKPRGEQAPGILFSEALEVYVQRRRPKWAKSRLPEKSEERVRWTFDKYAPSLLKKKFDSITHADLVALHSKVSNVAPISANRLMEYIRAIFTTVRGANEQNPARGIDRNPETKKTRFLTPEELAIFNEALDAEKDRDFADFVMLLLTTGQRKSVVYAARWDQFSEALGTWTIPIQKDRLPFTVELSPRAFAIFKKRYANRDENSSWIFPCGKRPSKSGHTEDYKKAWTQFIERTGLRDVSMHTLRHTNISYQVIGGASLKVAGAAVGHRSQQSTERYGHLIAAPVRAAVAAGEQTMERLAAEAKKVASKRLKQLRA